MGKSQKSISSKSIKINWVYPPEMSSYFSDNFVVQNQKDHFILSFFEVINPAILGSKEERQAQLEGLNDIDAKCISRIIVTPKKLKDIIDVLNENYNNYLKKSE